MSMSGEDFNLSHSCLGAVYCDEVRACCKAPFWRKGAVEGGGVLRGFFGRSAPLSIDEINKCLCLFFLNNLLGKLPKKKKLTTPDPKSCFQADDRVTAMIRARFLVWVTPPPRHRNALLHMRGGMR